MTAASVELRCGGKKSKCGKLLGHLHTSIDGPSGDPWIVLVWRGSPVCDHGADPLATLDRRTVDTVLARAAHAQRPKPYMVPTGTGRRPAVYPTCPPDTLE